MPLAVVVVVVLEMFVAALFVPVLVVVEIGRLALEAWFELESVVVAAELSAEWQRAAVNSQSIVEEKSNSLMVEAISEQNAAENSESLALLAGPDTAFDQLEEVVAEVLVAMAVESAVLVVVAGIVVAAMVEAVELVGSYVQVESVVFAVLVVVVGYAALVPVVPVVPVVFVALAVHTVLEATDAAAAHIEEPPDCLLRPTLSNIDNIARTAPKVILPLQQKLVV